LSQALKRVGILGLGQIGTSIALDLVSQGVEVYGVERDPRHREIVKGMEILRELYDHPRGLPRDLDLLILAVPLRAIPEIFSQLSSWSTPITDTATLKVPVLQRARETLLHPEIFLGGHPLAGREIPGPRGGREGTFRGKIWFLTPGEGKTDEGVEKAVYGLVELLGARAIVLDPSLHDHLMAVIIGLPHLMAFALGDLLREMAGEFPQLLTFSGGSLRDQLRVTSSSPEMVADILGFLREDLKGLAGKFLRSLERILEMEDSHPLEEKLLRIQRFLENHRVRPDS